MSLHRPRVKNAFNDDQYSDLIAMLQQVYSDDTLSAIVLTGSGPYFSSGADLNNMVEIEDGDGGIINKPSGRFMMELLKFPKIVVAAINGPAVGIGVTLLLHCDLVYCTEVATLWVPFTRIALVPEFCSSETFVQTMGLSNANELLLLGKKIDAELAVKRNICSGVIAGCDLSGDAFHISSIASKLCNDIDERLLSLPSGDKTSKIFISMVRSRRRKVLEEICKEELVKLDERLESGDVLEAAMQLASQRSKL